MKKLFYLLLIGAVMAGCRPGEDPAEPITEYEPILISRSELANSISLQGPKSIKEAGKIYRYGSLLFINDKYEGVHVYDNAEPTNPVAVAFINIPGNLDIAIKNDIIYADNATDLVAMRYTQGNLEVLSRSEDAFPEVVPPDLGVVPSEFSEENRPEGTVIVKWVKK